MIDNKQNNLPDVSIILVNYNTAKVTEQCIDSIFSRTHDLCFEIIVVDNASTDESREMFSRRMDITYIYSEINLGFGRGNNLGLQFANGKNILFLNTDTILLNNAIKILSDYLNSNPCVGACGGNLYNRDLMPTLSFERLRLSIKREICKLTKGSLLWLFYGRNRFFNYSGHPLEVGYVSGADFMTRKALLDEVGGFSDDIFMYYEESELTERIVKVGYKIHSVPNAKIQHLEGGTVQARGTQFNEKKARWMAESQKYYLTKLFPKWKIKLIQKLIVAQVLEKYIVSIISFNKKGISDCNKHFNILKETFN